MYKFETKKIVKQTIKKQNSLGIFVMVFVTPIAKKYTKLSKKKIPATAITINIKNKLKERKKKKKIIVSYYNALSPIFCCC